MAVQSRPERAQQPGPRGVPSENTLFNADDFPIAVAVQQFIAEHPGGATDTANRLFQRLQKYKTDSDHLWPKSARGFSAALIKAAAAFRLAGIEVRRPAGNHTEAGNLWTIRARSDVSVPEDKEPQLRVQHAERSAERAEYLCARRPANARELLEICQSQGL